MTPPAPTIQVCYDLPLSLIESLLLFGERLTQVDALAGVDKSNIGVQRRDYRESCFCPPRAKLRGRGQRGKSVTFEARAFAQVGHFNVPRQVALELGSGAGRIRLRVESAQGLLSMLRQPRCAGSG